MKPMRLPRARFNVTRMVEDMALRGWSAVDVAKVTGKSPATITNFLHGTRQTPKTASAIAHALGHPVRRYFSHVEAA